MISEEQAREALREVKDPGPNKKLGEVRLLKGVVVEAGRVRVELEQPAVGYLYKDDIANAVQNALISAGAAPGSIDVSWTLNVVGRVAKPDQPRLPGVKNIIAVAAGKGGVGKSTVASNLALALQKLGARVGLYDADVYGPSMPTMLGPPELAASTDASKKIIPAVHHGLKVMSVGFFIEREGAVVWRGPMVHKLLQQFLEDVDWGTLDYLVMDLPPGTGDAQLSLSQLVPISGAVMVTTPQEVAIIDVIKAIAMFKKVEIPLLGIVENMSGYVCPSCGHHDDIFSRGGGRKLAQDENTMFLGEVPIEGKIRYGGDVGRPVVVGAPEGVHAKIFLEIAAKVATKLATQLLSGPRRSPGLVTIK